MEVAITGLLEKNLKKLTGVKMIRISQRDGHIRQKNHIKSYKKAIIC